MKTLFYKISEELSHYEANAVYFVKEQNESFVKVLITDSNGVPFPVINADIIKDLYSKNIGWIQFNNTVNSDFTNSPQNFIKGVKSRLALRNDFIIDTYAFDQANNLVNNSNNKISPINVGDSFSARISFLVKSPSSDKGGVLYLDIGGDIGVIFEEDFDLSKSADKSKLVIIKVPFYTLETFLQNGGSVDCIFDEDVQVIDHTLLIQKLTHG